MKKKNQNKNETKKVKHINLTMNYQKPGRNCNCCALCISSLVFTEESKKATNLNPAHSKVTDKIKLQKHESEIVSFTYGRGLYFGKVVFLERVPWGEPLMHKELDTNYIHVCCLFSLKVIIKGYSVASKCWTFAHLHLLFRSQKFKEHKHLLLCTINIVHVNVYTRVIRSYLISGRLSFSVLIIEI